MLIIVIIIITLHIYLLQTTSQFSLDLFLSLHCAFMGMLSCLHILRYGITVRATLSLSVLSLMTVGSKQDWSVAAICGGRN